MAGRRVLFLAYGLDGVSCRFRIFQYLPYLPQMGIQAEVADLHVRPLQRRRILQSLSAYDAVYIHRAFLKPVEQRWLRDAGKPYVFDFDDAIMFRDSSHRRFESWSRRRRFGRMVTGADVVIAGNSYLAALAARHSNRVRLIPTMIDVAPYHACDAQPAAQPVIGWIGTRINLMYLRAILPALTRLRARRPEVQLKIVADDFLDVAGIEVIKKRWSLDDEVEDLRSFQVGIMPLPDDPWTRGKCAVKILQYFAASVPVVCSPVGANVEVVEHGRNGYFARTEEEWIARLDELLGDPEKRRRFGAAGRETVERKYSIQANLGRFVGSLTWTHTD
jgi:glycosyltransferase involved in cell wall biosynthesis